MNIRDTKARMLRGCGALLLSGLGGVGLFATFPPREGWWAAPLWLAVFFGLLRLYSKQPLRWWTGSGMGFVFGLGFFLPLLSWTGIFVGDFPWCALSVTMSLFIAVCGWLVVRLWRAPGAPIFVACAWGACEWFRGVWPFGGFPWGKLAFGQAGGFIEPIATLGGASLLSWVIAIIAAAIAWAVTGGVGSRISWIQLAASSAAVLCLVAVGQACIPPVEGGARLQVAAVQGGVPKLGLDFNSRPAAVLMMHIHEAQILAEHEKSGAIPRAQLVIMPENASDIDPQLYPWAGQQISEVAQELEAPVIVGTLDTSDPRAPKNTALVWDPQRGPVDRHDKVYLQPFGEYLPMRGFFRHFSSYADQAGRFVPGTGNGVVHAPLAGGDTVPVGIATCYEVIFDRALVDSVRGGAQILAVPANNATFGDSEMTYQQLAFSRIRAVELGRTVVVAATTGVSAIVEPDGRIVQQTGKITPAWLAAEVPLRTQRTPASYVLPWVDFVVLLGVIVGFVLTMRHGRLSSKKPVATVTEKSDEQSVLAEK